jgi:hypothetical protein
LRPGDVIELQIRPAVDPKRIRAVCFDEGTVTSKNVAARETTAVTLVVPGDQTSSQPLSGDVHTVIILFDGGSFVQKRLIAAVLLTNIIVPPATPRDPTYRIILQGDGFDPGNPLNHMVRLARTEGVDVDAGVCWSDADCEIKKTGIRGAIKSTRQMEIVGLDPGIARMSAFSVCRSETCSAALRDPQAYTLLWVPAVAWLGALLMVGVVVALVTQMKPMRIDGDKYLTTALFIDKETNTYSLSKLQFYMWTFVAVFGYLELLISRWWIQGQWTLPEIPSGLPGIVGLAAGTSVGAQVVSTMSGPKGAGQVKPSLADFVTSGEAVQADRVQFLVWTVVGSIGYFFVLTAIDPRTLTNLPEVPWSILSISGISALGYLGAKLARSGGPVINEIMARVGPDPGTGGAAGMPAGAAPAGGALTMQTATTKVAEARDQLATVRVSAAVQPVIDAARAAIDGAGRVLDKLSANDMAAAQIARAEAEARSKAAADAAAALKASSTASADDKTQAAVAANAAQAAAQVALTTQAAPGAATPGAARSTSATGISTGAFGLLEIRGRTLSSDATYRISKTEDPQQGEVLLSFDRLQPQVEIKAGEPPKPLAPKPRVIEIDDTSASHAKRLLLVIKLEDAELQSIFTAKTKHVLTITNPDAQKAMLTFTVPDTQRPV